MHLPLRPNLTVSIAANGKNVPMPRYLKFCQDYNEEACCIPGHDLENQVQFENLIDGLGPGCKNPMMYPAIRYFYCLGYTRDKGDGSDTQVISICQDFVEQALWHNETRRQYEECGVMKYNECPESMSDFDPYQCGDDLVIPTIFWSSATEFMNYMSPPGLYDFEFEVVPDADAVDESGEPTCWKPRQSECLQPGEQRGPASAKRGAEVAQRRRRGGELWLHRSHASLLEKGVKRVVTTCGLTPSSSSSGIAALAQVGPDAPICDDEHPNILRLPLRLVVGFLRQPVVIWQIRLPPVLCEAAEQRSDECLAVRWSLSRVLWKRYNAAQ
ncbi:hypothetical protein EMIHUDRAFT_112576 [Emiliania huxleyi CCMP1516]|uniref:Uncharacterized protein n=2 Tax=Emiliania huxleyi TaxID=2903 RepID=A0A0D3K7L8_EMIH1|nr:hypothetical protein EMIHUDRAFT_112576 [Emiliania huxleyi CCMP1516]EOD31753.1 hypothetical protein EMIHUDRAFT_112576 [Emiliania huxleyi CCMP1516]|eukprot:XP_005784182.1 hypothetical protein EMIHUDRAFT_112576 [Emiliania huxleyi CCMP1516]